ncbi:TIP41 protein [Thecamonas trahens ATCC 50062]|uniref:TIP41 protein n=1 Tax=Thecamonas trahens ATCC 50062 TaxID=461836 RepID=A0A0L0D5Z4_THETB|nr:TIP41 protein [Thecamonas trahens ATCC 50062]KNC47807.1 TIP41 protein [Thecamonas trahens ATCC 50062]|eukprot:XP_013759285.1 TIP41 protein [Thecamonas trahens ATCC 50062]
MAARTSLPVQPPEASTVLQVQGIDINGWKIRTVKSSILTSDEGEAWREALGLPELPEMVFGGARVQFVHSSGAIVTFKAFDALAMVDNQAQPPMVAASATWMQTASTEKAQDSVDAFDWTYNTAYGGTTGMLVEPSKELKVKPVEVKVQPVPENDAADNITPGDGDGPGVFVAVPAPVPPAKSIDYDLLRKREPILFFDEVMFFEDELADHGSSTLVAKLRVMPSAFFCLLRQFIRVDGVVVAVNDTRLFHAFGTSRVIRRITSATAECAALEAANPTITPAFYADVEAVIPLLTTTRDETEVLEL